MTIEVFYHLVSNELCRGLGDVCHCEKNLTFINIASMYRQDYADLAIFQGLSPEQIGEMSPYMQEIQMDAGQVIFSQGQSADFLYILLCGEVQVRYKPYDGPVLTVARILPGDVFGWSSALGREVYTSSAEVSQGGAAFRIPAGDLQCLCDRNPQAGKLLLERLASVIAERLRNTHSSILALLSQGVDRKGSCDKMEVRNE
jgi:CRP-like cAMP-binding protein